MFFDIKPSPMERVNSPDSHWVALWRRDEKDCQTV